jgi:hypothetical protein
MLPELSDAIRHLVTLEDGRGAFRDRIKAAKDNGDVSEEFAARQDYAQHLATHAKALHKVLRLGEHDVLGTLTAVRAHQILKAGGVE